MIVPDHPSLSIVRQCELLGVPRSSFYYEPKPKLSEADVLVMRRLDEIYNDFPYYGVRRMTAQLHRDGLVVNHKRVHRLMRVMGLEALYQRPRTSIPNEQHQHYPYLLQGVTAQYPNHIWGTDITYVRALGDWFYLVALLDWYSRFVISWQLSPTLDAAFCVANLERALQNAQPEIHNSDQGSQFTADEYLETLKAYPDIRISMDGRGRCMDNIFTERLWRTVKYEEVYLNEYDSFIAAETSLGDYFHQYNYRRLHQSLDYKTPAEIYFNKN